MHKPLKFAIHLIASQAIILSAMGVLHAQQVYKSVDKQGRVTYSEVPPQPSAGDKLIGDSASSAALPYALLQVVSRYPVTLYTNADCSPCINARIMLTQRGVPFNERTIISNEDIEAYKRLNSEASLPMITIASQQLKGYEEAEWSKYLDAAGYPKTSTLPRSYRNPEPAPLVAVKKSPEKPAVAEKPASVQPTQPVRPAPAAPNSNPAGIRF
ncbi:MAG: glutaredoxin family protein [Burkholderiaceae bacterium]|nr:glutaredoxin family protein [Burkholderiaceae bacterium]